MSVVAPVGMGEDDQIVWLIAAASVLDDVPIELLRRGIKVAMGEADHPSKIVRSIKLAIRDDMAFRERFAAPPIAAPAIEQPAPVLAITDDAPMTFDEVKAMTPQFRKIGLEKGWITQADYDRAASLA